MRVGVSYRIDDESASHYSPAVAYRYTLCIAATAPTVSTAWGAPPWNSGAQYHNSVHVNLPTLFTPLSQTVQLAGPYSCMISGIMLGGIGQKYYGQLFVEEIDLVTNTPNGHWAASRGAWIGVAP